MKQITLITMVFLTLVCWQQQALAQKTREPAAGPNPKANVEQLLAKMEQDWADAILKKDFATIERIVAADFIVVGLDGKESSREQMIAGLKSGEWIPESLTYENLKVRVFGDTAVVTLVQNEKSKTKGKDSSGQYLFMDVFLKRDGRWQIVAEQAARLEQQQKTLVN